jgi:hypothetical protein
MGIKTNANSTYPKVAVQWLNQVLCFYQNSCLVDSEVLRNRHLRVAAKRSILPLHSLIFIVDLFLPEVAIPSCLKSKIYQIFL